MWLNQMCKYGDNKQFLPQTFNQIVINHVGNPFRHVISKGAMVSLLKTICPTLEELSMDHIRASMFQAINSQRDHPRISPRSAGVQFMRSIATERISLPLGRDSHFLDSDAEHQRLHG